MLADNVLGWDIVLKISYLPSKLRFSAKYSFFGQSLSRRHYQPTYQPSEGVYLLNVSFQKCAILRSVRFIWFLLFLEFFVPRKMSSKKRKAEVDKENWISSAFLAPLQGKIMYNWTNNRLGFPISLWSQLLRSGLNKFAEEALGPVVFTHGLAVVAL